MFCCLLAFPDTTRRLTIIFPSLNDHQSTQYSHYSLHYRYDLIEGSAPDSHMVSGYEALLQKLEARLVISNKLERKKYLLYKLKLAKQSAKATNGDVQSKFEIRELTTELEGVQAQLDEMYTNYEHFHGEPYHILEVNA
jgi:hypothetical protein